MQVFDSHIGIPYNYCCTPTNIVLSLNLLFGLTSKSLYCTISPCITMAEVLFSSEFKQQYIKARLR